MTLFVKWETAALPHLGLLCANPSACNAFLNPSSAICVWMAPIYRTPSASVTVADRTEEQWDNMTDDGEWLIPWSSRKYWGWGHLNSALHGQVNMDLRPGWFILHWSLTTMNNYVSWALRPQDSRHSCCKPRREPSSKASEEQSKPQQMLYSCYTSVCWASTISTVLVPEDF